MVAETISSTFPRYYLLHSCYPSSSPCIQTPLKAKREVNHEANALKSVVLNTFLTFFLTWYLNGVTVSRKYFVLNLRMGGLMYGQYYGRLTKYQSIPLERSDKCKKAKKLFTTQAVWFHPSPSFIIIATNTMPPSTRRSLRSSKTSPSNSGDDAEVRALLSDDSGHTYRTLVTTAALS